MLMEIGIGGCMLGRRDCFLRIMLRLYDVHDEFAIALRRLMTDLSTESKHTLGRMLSRSQI